MGDDVMTGVWGAVSRWTHSAKRRFGILFDDMSILVLTFIYIFISFRLIKHICSHGSIREGPSLYYTYRDLHATVIIIIPLTLRYSFYKVFVISVGFDQRSYSSPGWLILVWVARAGVQLPVQDEVLHNKAL